jgi:flagellar biosynthesis protein FlhG
MAAKVWVVGAGKGGVGKTFVSSSLAITLAKIGHRVALIDYDLSCANLHTCIGIAPSSKNIFDYLDNKATLSQLVHETKIPKLSLIQGVWNQWTPIAPEFCARKNLINDARALDFDYVIIDQGPGATELHLNHFVEADESILVSTPEPTSIEKSYRFLESYLWHQYVKHGAKPELRGVLDDYRKMPKIAQGTFQQFLEQKVRLGRAEFDLIHQKPIRLIVNESRSHLDHDLGHSIKSVCTKFFELNLKYLGSIDYDNAVWQAVRNKEAFLVSKPFTPLSGQFLALCKSLIGPEMHAQQFRAVI